MTAEKEHFEEAQSVIQTFNHTKCGACACQSKTSAVSGKHVDLNPPFYISSL